MRGRPAIMRARKKERGTKADFTGYAAAAAAAACRLPPLL